MKRFFFLFIFVLLFLISCSPIKVACVGDSITYGSSIKYRDSLSYPAQLQRLLGDKYMVGNFGHSGATMLKKGNKPYWSLPEFEKSKVFNADVVIIMLGTNDTKPVNWSLKTDYIPNYKELIKVYQNQKNHPKVILCLPPPVFENKWTIQQEVVKNEVIPSILQLTKEQDLTYFDMYALLIDHPEFLTDKVHPNKNGAAEIAKLIAKKLTE